MTDEEIQELQQLNSSDVHDLNYHQLQRYIFLLDKLNDQLVAQIKELQK